MYLYKSQNISAWQSSIKHPLTLTMLRTRYLVCNGASFFPIYLVLFIDQWKKVALPSMKGWTTIEITRC
jgi:hypothetical protein